MGLRCGHMTIKSVGVRELKDRASALLRRAKDGEAITVTDRGRPVAVLVPAASARGVEERVEALVRSGRVTWSGGKPRGLERAPVVRRGTVASAVTRGRR
jgi:prevent-host-death family protein